MFKLDTWVSYVAANYMKQITDVFGRKLEKKGVTRIQWIALYYIGKNGTLNQNELASYMDIKGSTVARLIDRMERDELVCRVKDENDRRATILSLTEKGEKYREELLPEGQIFSDEVMSGISVEELEIFNSVMNRMLENAMKIDG